MSSFETEELRDIYDRFAAGYDRGRTAFDNIAQLQMLAARIPDEADVLDAGRGSGAPVLKFFADGGHRISGADISSAMLELAAERVPSARLMEADSALLDFESESFDLITSFYSLFHLEMDAQRKAVAGFHRMLRPGGLAYFTLASERYTEAPVFCGTKVFEGAELPYSHVTPESYHRIFEEAGFIVEQMDHLLIGGEDMLWVLVEKESK